MPGPHSPNPGVGTNGPAPYPEPSSHEPQALDYPHDLGAAEPAFAARWAAKEAVIKAWSGSRSRSGRCCRRTSTAISTVVTEYVGQAAGQADRGHR